MRVLISGAGVAGLTLAYWLKRYGFSPTIVERAPILITGGYKVDVRGSALTVLRKMNIYDAITAASTDMQSALLIDKKGKIIQKMSGNDFGHRCADDLEIVRGKLCSILKDSLTDVECLFGDSIESFSQTASGVTVNFKNNQRREFDLVIGTDGVHSNVRQQIFGKEELFANNLGVYLCVFSIPNYLDLDRVEIQYSELGRIAQIWCSHNDESAKACFGFIAPATKVDLNNRVKQETLIREIYKDIDWELPKIFQIMPDAKDFYFDCANLIQMEQWSLDRVVLVGDAAYCASPLSGQGISLALIGAYVLAGELHEAKGNHKIAFQNYEKIMRSFVEKNQNLAKKSANLMNAKEHKNN